MEPNFAFRNNGDGTFTDRASEWGISTDDEGRARSGMGVDIADYRNNGVFALAIGNFNFQGMGFYEKTPTPPYADVAKRAHIFEPSYPYITFGVCFSDLDNDGFPDLFLTNGHILDNISKTNPQQTYAQPPLLFRNKGDGTFMETAQAAGISAPLVGRGACRGDFDNDGKEDLLLIPNTGAPRLLRNETTGTYNWLTIELVGSKGNRNGFGAQVTVTAGGTSHTAVCKSGGSYLSESDPRLHFGLGSATAIEAISVRWSNGTQEKISPASPNQVVRIIEGTKQVKPIAK